MVQVSGLYMLCIGCLKLACSYDLGTYFNLGISFRHQIHFKHLQIVKRSEPAKNEYHFHFMLAEFTLSLPYGIYYTNTFLMLKETSDLIFCINQDIEKPSRQPGYKYFIFLGAIEFDFIFFLHFYMNPVIKYIVIHFYF